LSNEAGIAWGKQLQPDMSDVYRWLQAKSDTTPEAALQSDFSSVLFKAIHSDGSAEQTTVKLQDAAGIEHSFYVSVGAIETGAVSTSDRESPAEKGLVILLSDFSALMATRRQLEQKSRLNALGVLATGIAHELNQPLNSIRLALANIRRRMEVNTLDETTLSEKVARLDEQVSRMGVLIKAMRAYSSEENDHPEPIDPLDVLDNILSIVNQEVTSHRISLSRESSGSAVTLVANPNVLGRLFTEVLTNAIEALKDVEDKQRELDLVATTDGQYWVLEITDNGNGFELAMGDRLYEPFYTTKDDVEHAGLGLTTCWNIVEQLGGSISISRQDDVTKVRIALQIVGSAEETRHAATN
jgi:C4-dicarboxylate-specific signal transduction histidine kinase